ncbi:unnamed protein product [Alopecurus aequalis]
MAMLVSRVPSKALALYTPEVSRRQTNTGISVSAHRRPIGLTTKSWRINCVPPTTGATQIPTVDPAEPPAGGKLPAVDPGPKEPPAGGKFSLPNIPSWVKLIAGAYFAAVPFYWQMRAMEERVEQTVEEAIEAVDKMAVTAEKIAEEVAEAFPENKSLRNATSRIKAIADEIDEDANKAEALLHKIEQIEEEADEAVDSFTKKKSKGKNP